MEFSILEILISLVFLIKLTIGFNTYKSVANRSEYFLIRAGMNLNENFKYTLELARFCLKFKIVKVGGKNETFKCRNVLKSKKMISIRIFLYRELKGLYPKEFGVSSLKSIPCELKNIFKCLKNKLICIKILKKSLKIGEIK